MDTLMSMFASNIQASRIENMKPLFKNTGAKRIKITLGPFTIQPANAKRSWNPTRMDPNSEVWLNNVKGLPQDILVLSTNTTLTYADGTVADVVNGIYNHHFMVLDLKKSTTGPIACPDGKVTGAPVSPLMGSSEANRDLLFVAPEVDFNGGYYIGKSAQIMLSAEIVNYTNDTKKIYSVTEMEYVPGRPRGSLDTGLQIIDVGQCEVKGSTAGMAGMEGMIMAPKDKKIFSVESKKMSITQDGFILFRRGHMHDGGDGVVLKINNNTICNSKAIYGGDTQSTTSASGKKWETISHMAECHDVVKVKKGDELTVQANFDLEKHPPRELTHDSGMGEQMGLVTFMFAAAPKK
jgi:hypothetical protein